MWKEGDIFRWSWKEIKGALPYWCCSQIGVVKNDKLVDTYGLSLERSWTKEKASEEIILEFIANEEDLIKANPQERMYYDDKDCVDLTHANSYGPKFFIRRGAIRSLDKMSTVMDREIDRVESQLSHLNYKLERLKKEKEQLTTESNLCMLDKDTYLGDKHSYE